MNKKAIVLLVLIAMGMTLCLSGCQKTRAMGGGLSKVEPSENDLVGAAELSEAVESIDISWSAGTVTIMTSNASTVFFSEESDKELTDDTRLRYWLDGTTLRIRFCRSEQWLLNDLKKDLTVTVPENVKLAGLNVNSVSAAIDMDAVQAESVEVSTTSGSVRLTDCVVTEQMTFNSVSGALDARLVQPLNSFQSVTTSGVCRLNAPSVACFHADSVSGTVDLATGDAPERLDISTISGRVGLALSKDASFTLIYSSTSGDLSSDLSYTREKGQYRFGDGRSAFGIVTVSGDVRISIAQ